MDLDRLKVVTTSTTRRFVKGVLLIGWISVLVSLAGLAASGRASEAVLEFFKPYSFDYWDLRDEKTPSQHLDRYLQRYDYPPPIESILDLILFDPSWSDRNIVSQFQKLDESESEYDYKRKRNKWSTEQYDALFRRVDAMLHALVSDHTVNLEQLSINRPEIPNVFELASTKITEAQALNVAAIKIPREVASWIKEERLRQDLAKQRNSLINTFFLLMVLGAFGSLIFLTKDYIEREEQTLIAAYVFRPILGMFLAVAVFIVDIVAHSVISTADILQTRHETLFLLALAAGMLSEQAYAVVSIRAQSALDKLREKKESSSNSESSE